MNPPADPAKKPAYFGLVALTGVFSLAAVLTLVPYSDSPWPNLWLYKSFCPFAPGATAACAFLAGLCCTVRNRLVRGERSAPLVPVLVLATLLGLTVWGAVVWLDIKSRYTDVHTGATIDGS